MPTSPTTTTQIAEDEFTHSARVPIKLPADEIRASMSMYEFVRVRTQPGTFAYEGLAVMLDKLLSELQEAEGNPNLSLEDVLGPRIDHVGLALDADGNLSEAANEVLGVEPQMPDLEAADDPAVTSESA